MRCAVGRVPSRGARSALQPAGETSGLKPGGDAFTLIEMMGVLAVVVILASVVFSTTIRQLQQIAGDSESTNLLSYATALQNSIQRNRYVPGAADWASVVATELGRDPGSVSTNANRQPRIFWIDPQLQLGTNNGGLPYLQTVTGSAVTTNGNVIPPASPRLMILSSLGPAWPVAITNGTPAATNFNAFWNTADGTLPPAPALAGWTGTGTDLKVQRLSLSPLFVRLLLYNYSSADQGRYAIDRNSPTNSVPTAGVLAYFLKGSVLQLLTGSGAVDSEQVLQRDTGLVYYQGVWQGTISSGPTNTLANTYTGDQLAQDFEVFISAPGNPNASGGATPVLVVNTVSNFFNLYNTWAGAGFPTSGATYTAAKDAQTQMQAAMQNLAADFEAGECD